MRSSQYFLSETVVFSVVLLHLNFLFLSLHPQICSSSSFQSSNAVPGGSKFVDPYTEYQTSVLSPEASTPVANKLCPFKAFNTMINQATVNLLSYKSLFIHPRRSRIVTGSLSSLQRYHSVKSVSSHELYAQLVDQQVEVESSTSINVEDKVVKKKKKSAGAEALEVVVIGLSHHNAKVEVREKLAIPEANWSEASAALCEQYDSISEAAVLSTCNRFELYLSGKNQYECMRAAVDFLYERAGGTLDQVTLRRNLFMLTGEDAIWHLLKVSAGLDSLIVGEGQILAQVKRCYERGSATDGKAGKVVARLLNTAVTAGKRVRAETGISKGAVSISSAALEFSQMTLARDCGITTGLKDARISIIGAGKMARLLLVHLGTLDVKKVIIVNRSKDKMAELQAEFPDLEIEFKLMDEMWDVIKESDVVYPSTAAETTIIDPAPLQACLQGRHGNGGVQFVDISVPRNVHPDCSTVSGAHCYNVDDLKLVVERNTAKRRREMIEAEHILREELERFRLWQQSLGAIPTIAKLQEKAETMRLEEMNKVSKKLASLSSKDLETVEKVTKGIVAKLLHGPMSHLRQQTEGDATRAAIKQVQQAFQLDQQ
eukprot:gene30699-39983_t